jgi:hypothetical protein
MVRELTVEYQRLCTRRLTQTVIGPEHERSLGGSGPYKRGKLVAVLTYPPQ